MNVYENEETGSKNRKIVLRGRKCCREAQALSLKLMRMFTVMSSFSRKVMLEKKKIEWKGNEGN